MCVGAEREGGQERSCVQGIEGLESQTKQTDLDLNSASQNGACIYFEYLQEKRTNIAFFFFFGGSILLKDFGRISCL